MRKIIIASHHKMASGIKDTLEFIAGEQQNVMAIDAYLDNIPLDDTLKTIFQEKNDDDEIVVLTDLKAGSVNQGFIKYLGQQHVHLLSGMNLPLALSIALAPTNQYLDDQTIQHYIDESKNEIIYMNTVLADMEVNDDDE